MNKIKNMFRDNPEVLSLIFFIFGGALVCYITNNFLVMFAPFIIAYILTVLLRPYIERFHDKTHIPIALSTIICLVLCISLSFTILTSALYFILDGCTYLIDFVSTSSVADTIIAFFVNMDSNLVYLTKISPIDVNPEDITSMFADLGKGIVTVASKISFNLVTNTPNFIIAFIITCVASAYMLFDSIRLRLCAAGSKCAAPVPVPIPFDADLTVSY